ncbi:hypothetical protein Ahia01_001168200, partial [Argonauta hians]
IYIYIYIHIYEKFLYVCVRKYLCLYVNIYIYVRLYESTVVPRLMSVCEEFVPCFYYELRIEIKVTSELDGLFGASDQTTIRFGKTSISRNLAKPGNTANPDKSMVIHSMICIKIQKN